MISFCANCGRKCHPTEESMELARYGAYTVEYVCTCGESWEEDVE